MTDLNKEAAPAKDGKDHALLAMGCVLLAIGVTLHSTANGIWVPLLFLASSAVLLVKCLVQAFKNSDEKQ